MSFIIKFQPHNSSHWQEAGRAGNQHNAEQTAKSVINRSNVARVQVLNSGGSVVFSI